MSIYDRFGNESSQGANDSIPVHYFTALLGEVLRNKLTKGAALGKLENHFGLSFDTAETAQLQALLDLLDETAPDYAHINDVATLLESGAYTKTEAHDSLGTTD